ncbi:MAG: hypothetical protein HKN35_14530 [Woeseia sp.]|nr:SdiA-regulated domain-containing protein [Woeseia sp.]MBT8096465.1 SdiA-regulated domain-containing protein [Woeseia sp.]NNE62108.1 hypothetical protein [Woeseia sp.]NNL55312.1 hypothetical protein [Woeseia sp.]
MLLCVLPYVCTADDAGMLSAYPLDAEHMVQWRLPERLHEVSGLALTRDERLFSIADERALVFEMDVENRRLKKVFALGDPVVRGDFEGIAVFDDTFYLITSAGEIFAAQEGADGEKVDYTVTSTGLGELCEIEGLATDVVQRRLLIACKQIRNGMQRLPIFAWSIDDKTLLESATIDIPVSDITQEIKERRFNPSGIAVDVKTGHLLLIASRQHSIVELASDGRLLRALKLPMKHRHRQPEGIELMSDGRLLIADEGGNHKARLAVYTSQ